jgi:hypothetical protein
MKSRDHIDKSIDELLDRIVEDFDAEPDSILNINPGYFSTEHLYNLKNLWLKRNKRYNLYFRLVFGLGVLSPIFFTIGAIGFWANGILGIIFFPLSIVSFLSFFFGIFILASNFKSSGYQDKVKLEIDKELKKRGHLKDRKTYD